MNIKRKKELLDTSFAEIIRNQQSTVSYKKKKNNQQSFLSLGLNAFDFTLQALNFLLAFFKEYQLLYYRAINSLLFTLFSGCEICYNSELILIHSQDFQKQLICYLKIQELLKFFVKISCNSRFCFYLSISK